MPARKHRRLLPDGLEWLSYLSGGSQSHCDISIYFIFSQSTHQVDIKNVVIYKEDFLTYSNTPGTYHGMVLSPGALPYLGLLAERVSEA